MANTFDEDTTIFLNVDLDIFSKSRLDQLVAAFGEKIDLHYVGRDRSRYSAHFALSGILSNSADSTIKALVNLVEKLPSPARKLWNDAQVKNFNIGIQGGIKPRFTEFPLHSDTLRAVVKLGARVVITVYAANQISVNAEKLKSKRATGRPKRPSLSKRPQRERRVRLRTVL